MAHALRPRNAPSPRISRTVAPVRCQVESAAPAGEDPLLPEGTFNTLDGHNGMVSAATGFGANIVNSRIVSVYGME